MKKYMVLNLSKETKEVVKVFKQIKPNFNLRKVFDSLKGDTTIKNIIEVNLIKGYNIIGIQKDENNKPYVILYNDKNNNTKALLIKRR